LFLNSGDIIAGSAIPASVRYRHSQKSHAVAQLVIDGAHEVARPLAKQK
jgi:hypothetical protein